MQSIEITPCQRRVSTYPNNPITLDGFTKAIKNAYQAKLTDPEYIILNKTGIEGLYALLLNGGETNALVVNETANVSISGESNVDTLLLTPSAGETTVTVEGGSSVGTVTVGGGNVTVNVEDGGNVDEIITTASGTTVNAEGTVGQVVFDENSTDVTIQNTGAATAGGSIGSWVVPNGIVAGAAILVGGEWAIVDHQRPSATGKGDDGNTAETKRPHEHQWSLSFDADHHFYKCTAPGCGETKDTQPHTYANWQANSGGTHTGTCVCSKTFTEARSGGTATCTAKAQCAACGEEYGEKAGHVWGENWTTGDGKHWHKCTTPNCTATTEEAEYSGGTATCTAKAQCAACGEEYGALADHVFSTDWTGADGYHWHKCTNPNCREISDRTQCSGGEATCVAKANCAVCGCEYGDYGEHVYELVEAEIPATCLATGTTALYQCIYHKDAKTGGDEIPTLTSHVWDTTIWITDEDKHWHKCKFCDATTDVGAHTYQDYKCTVCEMDEPVVIGGN